MGKVSLLDHAMLIIQGNVFDVEVEEGTVDLIITSPPRILLESKLKDLFCWVEKCLSSNGIFVLERPGLYNKAAQSVNRLVVDLVEKRVESRLSSQFFIPVYHLYQDSDFHAFFVFSQRELKPFDFIPYRKYNEREMSHSCEFDDVLIQGLICRFSEPGSVVLDPFCGTGVVPCQAHLMGRDGMGIDLRSPYTNLME